MSEGRPLAGRAISAAKWSYAGNIARAVGQFLIGIVLARILGPKAFGVVAIAWLMISAGKLVSDFGFGAALVQRKELTPRDIQFAFTIQLLIGIGLTLVGIFSAPYVAGYFKQPEAAPVIKAMSFLFVVQSIGQTGTSLLSRQLEFKSIQLANVATYLLAYLGIGIPFALLGMGVWSLVVAQTLQAVSYAIAVVWLSGMRPRLSLRPDSPGMFYFGAKVISANIASWGILNLDSAVAGRAFGVSDLGLYNRAMALAATPTATVTTSMQGVLFSSCARTQDNVGRVRSAYLGATGLLGLVTVPVFVTVALVPGTVVSAVYGSAWMKATTIVAPLALAMPVHAILALVGPVLMALNRVELEVRSQWLALLVMIPLLLLAAMYSLAALAWTVLMAYLVRLVLLVIAMRKVVPFSWGEWLRALLPAVLFTAMVAVPTFLADTFAGLQEAGVRLMTDLAIAGALSALALRVIGPSIANGPMGNVIGEQLPGIVRRWARIA